MGKPLKCWRRKIEIIRTLSDLSRDGWKNARSEDYVGLERELREINNGETK